MTDAVLHEPARETPVVADVDVLVCGGGPAGYCAAIAASRAGARTLLVEREVLPGGAAVHGLVLPLMTFHATPEDQVVRGIGEELVREVVRRGGSPGHLPDPLGCAATITPVDPEVLKASILALLDASGVELLTRTDVVGAIREGDRVAGILVENKSGRGAIRARVVVDATGDADVAARAGAATVHGRTSDGLTQPLTWMFRLYGVDGAAVRRHVRDSPEDFVLSEAARASVEDLPILGVAGFFSKVRAAQEAGRLGEFRDRVLYFEMPTPGEVVVNMTRVTGRSGVHAGELTRGALEAFAQIDEVIGFLRAEIPGFAAARVMQVAPSVGVRETRHLVGRYTLEAEDVVTGRRFDDGVARGAFPIDLHSPDGKGLTLIEMEPGASYSIPYRCLLPRDLDGLLVAGRAISATHEASASSRLSPTCMALGEAAGTAAALAVRAGTEVAEVDPVRLRAALEDAGAVV